MKLYATVTIRTGWPPDQMKTHELGEVTMYTLAEFLAKECDERTLNVTIGLWNEKKLEEGRRQAP